MHVLIVPSWYPTERVPVAGVFFREQALALHDVGHDVGVIYPDLRPLKRWRTIFTGAHRIEATVDAGLRTLRSHGMDWFPRLPRASSWLWARHGALLFEEYLRQWGRPDLIHAHSMLEAGIVALEIDRRHGVPFVVTEHATAFARGVLSSSDLERARAVAKAARQRFAVSPPFSSLLERMLGPASGAWDEMPNIVHRSFATAPLRHRDRGDPAFRFVTVALLDPKKGIRNLIQAFATAFANAADVRLDIAGDGAERLELEALAHDLGLGDRVHFHGAVDRAQVAEIVSRADAFVSSSHFETFGVAVVEALALGKPVLATRSGGPESIVRPEDGMLVPVGDIGALADGMRRLHAEYGGYDPQAIRVACLARYGEAAVVHRLTEVYATAVGRGVDR